VDTDDIATIRAARWIEPVEAEPRRPVQRPAYHLAGAFDVPGDVRAATLHATAHGVFEAFINGERLGDAELLPEPTSYRKRLQVHTFDVTHLVHPGANAVGAVLSDGWWRSLHTGTRHADPFGPTIALLLALRIERASGEVLIVTTDATWRSTPSHILAADLIAGEVHDHRRRRPDWSTPGVDRSDWDPVTVADHPTDVLVPAEGPRIRRVDELPAVSVRELAPGRHVVDFGQNSNGWVRLSDLGPAGTTLTIVHGETLDEDGDVTIANVAHDDPTRPVGPVTFQTDVVTSAGDASTFEPRHSTKGFRYVRVEGHPGPLAPASITSVVVQSDLRRIGGFTCSNARIDRLHEAADWSFRSNVCGIPTDCPQRERAGWTGDWQCFITTAAYLYDVHDFSARWLRDLAAEQWDDGTVLNMVPDPHDLDDPTYATWRGAQGSSGWGDAACHVPWEQYVAYGRTDVLAAQLDSMRRWVDFTARRAENGRHPTRAAERPEPAAHERFIVDTGFHFGEWTEPDAPRFHEIMTMDHGPTATAFFHRSARELAAAAAVLGEHDLHDRYSALADDVRSAWCAEFVDDAGHVQPQRQANLVRALAFELLPEPLRQTAADDLVALIRAAGTHLGTGFLATPFLLPVLADNGHLDVTYELLLQDTPPSWLAMIDRGATTVWEDWHGRTSLNHYSKGAVITFLHRYVAGLSPLEPGYRRSRVAPRPGGGLTSAATYQESPHGRIEVSWSLQDGTVEVDIVVPPGTEAVVDLPGRPEEVVSTGSYRRAFVPAVRP
jgi:alpha-L-rhamnosidase